MLYICVATFYKGAERDKINVARLYREVQSWNTWRKALPRSSIVHRFIYICIGKNLQGVPWNYLALLSITYVHTYSEVQRVLWVGWSC